MLCLILTSAEGNIASAGWPIREEAAAIADGILHTDDHQGKSLSKKLTHLKWHYSGHRQQALVLQDLEYALVDWTKDLRRLAN